MHKSLLLAVIACVLLVASPARAQFCPGVSPWVFDDVAASDPFCGYITWMAQNGITLGCQVIDANHRLYCPNANVSRAAMAAFMNRLGNVRVEAVDTGPGLTGGPITSVGTINLASTQLLPTTACTNNQIPRWNGSAWTCSTDANSGGTVTSVGSGTGLSGGPITTTGSLSIAASYQLPQSCTNGQVPKSNGAGGWTCASDANSGGTVTNITAGNGLTGGTITASGTIAVDMDAMAANFHKQGGNAYGTTSVIGTTDNNPIEVRANGTRVMRYEPDAVSPNLIGGRSVNSVTAGARGAAIGGGGSALNADPLWGGKPNRVTDIYGTVAGGLGNVAGDGAGTPTDRPFATVSGGYSNTASGDSATVGGGGQNVADGSAATVSGGANNTASGLLSTVSGGNSNDATNTYSTIGGGSTNLASGLSSTVAGGGVNSASGDSSVIAGGSGNTASGNWTAVGGGSNNAASGFAAAIPGGSNNSASGTYSFAAGRRAKATTTGTFMWADSSDFDFAPSVNNFFGARATGGVGFTVKINGSGAPVEYCNFLPGYAGWNCTSDRNAKENLALVQGEEVLQRLIAMPVYLYNFKGADPALRMMGPTAQDFLAAFGLGDSETTIATGNIQGVALAAIQGLHAKLEAQTREIEAARARIADLESAHAREIAELRRAVEVLMARTSPEGRVAAK